MIVNCGIQIKLIKVLSQTAIVSLIYRVYAGILPDAFEFTYADTVYCFCFAVKKFRCFRGSLCYCESFSVNIAIKSASVTDNRESFSGNERKDVKLNRETFSPRNKNNIR